MLSLLLFSLVLAYHRCLVTTLYSSSEPSFIPFSLSLYSSLSLLHFSIRIVAHFYHSPRGLLCIGSTAGVGGLG